MSPDPPAYPPQPPAYPQGRPGQQPQPIDVAAAMRRIPPAEGLIGASLLLLFIFSFIGGWIRVFGTCSAVGCDTGSFSYDSLWDGFGILPALLIIFAILWFVIRAFPRARASLLLPIPDSVIWMGFAVLLVILFLLHWVIDNNANVFASASSMPGWVMFVAIVLAAAMFAGGYISYQKGPKLAFGSMGGRPDAFAPPAPPGASNFAPAASPGTPAASNFPPPVSPATPGASNYVPAATPLTPGASNYAPAATPLTPGASNYAPAATPFTPGASNYAPAGTPVPAASPAPSPAPVAAPGDRTVPVAPVAVGSLSPDRQQWFDGSSWRSTAESAPPRAPRSDDGYYWWDGKAWRPVPR